MTYGLIFQVWHSSGIFSDIPVAWLGVAVAYDMVFQWHCLVLQWNMVWYSSGIWAGILDQYSSWI